MQTSLARRRRRRRNERRPSGGGSVRTVAIVLPLFLLGTLVLVGLMGLVSVVAAYNHYSEGLPDPKQLLTSLDFAQQTKVYDRTGAVELARLGDFKREIVEYPDIPPEVIDATTAIEDKSFWDNAGFDPIGIVSAGVDTLRGRERGASTITQQLVRARLLPASAFEGSVYERKIKEIIQSVRLTQAFPGEEGKQRIMAAYLNQNFYGNQSYGVKAAAKGYFGKDLADLTLAQAAILAAIPQSPSRFDLVKNAETICDVEVAADAVCPAGKAHLVVPAGSEVVQRRNYILELMKVRSVLSGSRHTAAEYDAAIKEPVELVAQTTQPWKAAQFVWQVQQQLGEIVCGPESADSCEAVAVGGYQVVTTLDWTMQQSVEKWLYVSARAPQSKNTDAILAQYKIPKSDYGWIRALKGRNIQNAASAIMDARTGQVLAYAGSAGYTAKGNPAFQPQFDVLSDGYRQPGSAIKPIDYAIGIDDKTLTAATMFMDVVTDFGTKGKPFTPTQADGLERGPVRLRSALQFSLNIPAIKAGLINGLDHQFQRTKDFGLTYLPGVGPVTSMSIGTLETPPIDMTEAYATIANGGVRMPRQLILEVRDSSGNKIWPVDGAAPTGERVISAQAAYIVSDILAGNTDKSVNPYWADWTIYDGKTRRPAAYKTGTTSDNRDVAAYGFLPPPADPAAPQLVVGVWMGNSDSTPNKGSLSLDSSAPLWSNILTEVSKGLPIARFEDARPKGIVNTKVDAFSGLLPGPFTTKTVTELFISDTVPRKVDDTKRAIQIDTLTGDLWADGCFGPPETKGYLDLSGVDSNFPTWQKANADWVARATKGAGVRGGPEKTKTSYFYNGAFAPFGRTWGAPFAPTATCVPPPTPPPCDPFWSPDPNASPDPLHPTPLPCPSIEPTPAPSVAVPTPRPSATPKAKPSPKPQPTPPPSP
jgi:membrane peptidoglycan carboxypeptidase